MTDDIDRRVYQREFEDRLGYGTTWFTRLEREGKIPPAKRDPGGKRKWWSAADVRATIAKLGQTEEAA